MSVTMSSQLTQHAYRWTAWKAIRSSKGLYHQYEDDGIEYTIWGYDGLVVHTTTIWKGTVPYGVVDSGYSQSQNDTDKVDFETNYIASANISQLPITGSVNIAGVPKTTDGKLIVTISPSSEGWKTWFTGAGDHIASGTRGEGERILLSWTAEEDRGSKYVDIQFIEPIEIHDGQGVMVGNWTPTDYIDLGAVIPASTTTSNVSGTGDCNRVDTGQGFDLIVPSYGGPGGHDLILAAPVESFTDSGYWDVDHDSGEVTPSSTPGSARWNLISVPIEAFFIRKVPLGQGHGVLDVDVYKTEWIHPAWLTRIRVNKQSAGAGEFGGWLLTFRKSTTI